jgi:hypothetical protein
MNRCLLCLRILIPALLCLACAGTPDVPEVATDTFIIQDFTPLTNLKSGEVLCLDYTEAIEQGFMIPTTRQARNGLFRMEFSIRNIDETPQRFYYKIFYQNESYKFPERDPSDSLKQHPNAWENFYGSWEVVQKTFAETNVIPNDGQFYEVVDSFRIVGNPRDEQRYYTAEQNTRWKRNPRVGEYGFLLVVTTGDNIAKGKIPSWIQNIGEIHDNTFVHPYFYFLYGEGRMLGNTVARLSSTRLKVVAKPDLGGGIYINPSTFDKATTEKYATDLCGQDPAFYRTAPFEQFIHYIDPATKLYNIPVIADVLKDNYSRKDYNWNQRFYRKEELIATPPVTASRPCETVRSDAVHNKIVIRNPHAEFGKWQKQNVGVITRHGMTYGKWTVKAKLTEILNCNNMWNGITNAIWLITMDEGHWNYRRDCAGEGYMANYYGGQQDMRVKNTGYSEIDFEILKTVPYCPPWVLPPAYHYGIDDQFNLSNWNVPFPEEVIDADNQITVSCTNWDMACPQPEQYHAGCYPIRYEEQTFWAHRWDMNYRALTEKKPEADDELFGSEYYYFQIDWQPQAIIWRIGPSKDKLRVVGYMDQQVTSIPNNQMKLIITQEFHNTKWWIGSMYSQENIPFPKNDIVGEIYEVTIE